MNEDTRAVVERYYAELPELSAEDAWWAEEADTADHAEWIAEKLKDTLTVSEDLKTIPAKWLLKMLRVELATDEDELRIEFEDDEVRQAFIKNNPLPYYELICGTDLGVYLNPAHLLAMKQHGYQNQHFRNFEALTKAGREDSVLTVYPLIHPQREGEFLDLVLSAGYVVPEGWEVTLTPFRDWATYEKPTLDPEVYSVTVARKHFGSLYSEAGFVDYPWDDHDSIASFKFLPEMREL